MDTHHTRINGGQDKHQNRQLIMNFGPYLAQVEPNLLEMTAFLQTLDTSKRTSRTADIKQMRKDIDSRLSSAVPSLLKFDFEQHEKRAERHSYKGNDLKKRKGPGEFSSAHVASKATEKEAENERPFNCFDKSDEKRRRKDDPSKVSKKKPKKC
ncbi:uncharacterized protein LOC115669303 [Syzygium oleosum]|uniref:uncharacterized protein LOC115669303 n=1 Tax=Syzygium oleosum TaxID=219896 RepID=UPI0024B8AB0A|nr:uncharacterized protein LOC115669303 [Syzygium oleosum]